jgi:hypothetical protein
MRGLNLLIFVPSLIQHTKFDEDRLNASDEMVSYIYDSGMKNATGKERASIEKSKFNKINTKKEFTKNNVHFHVPPSCQEIKEMYLRELAAKSKVRTNIFAAISVCGRHMKRISGKKQFKVELEVRQFKMEEGLTYLEFYLREIEGGDEKNDQILNSNITQMDK